MSIRRIALIPNAKNSFAEAIRDRTRCAICRERIENGQEIEVRDDRTQVHVMCLSE